MCFLQDGHLVVCSILVRSLGDLGPRLLLTRTCKSVAEQSKFPHQCDCHPHSNCSRCWWCPLELLVLLLPSTPLPSLCLWSWLPTPALLRRLCSGNWNHSAQTHGEPDMPRTLRPPGMALSYWLMGEGIWKPSSLAWSPTGREVWHTLQHSPLGSGWGWDLSQHGTLAWLPSPLIRLLLLPFCPL